jgi:hypothetical protein
MEPLLQQPDPAHPGLLLVLANPDQRRWLGPRLLLRRPARVLHHVSGVQRPVLTDGPAAAVVIASIVAGVSALFGP